MFPNIKFVEPISPPDNYGSLLESYGIPFRKSGYYLFVGEINQVQGWIIHLSAIRSQVFEMLQVIVPEIWSWKIPFKIIQNKATASLLSGGMLEYAELGKIISIYPEDEQVAKKVVRRLIDLTKEFKGPAIPTDINLGSVVYTRYGGFNPKILADINGRTAAFIVDQNGNLVEDAKTIPFKLPQGVNWPFLEFASPIPKQMNSILNNRYRIVSVIKADAKGRVFKALRLKSWRIEWCLIKEGAQFMSADDEGRDIGDRLAWQFQLQRELSVEGIVPKAYDLFHDNGNTYLAMEFIKGTPLQGLIGKIHDSKAWPALEKKVKLQIIEYLLNIVKLIQTLHRKGFIHRDITPANFILNRREEFVMIDLELAYSKTRTNLTSSPFTLGTEGFMSPEQREVQQPTEKEDIYGLGGLMIVFFTGLFPVKFDTENSGNLDQDLNYFLHSKTLSSLITNCLAREPRKRPDLQTIKDTLLSYRQEVLVMEQTKFQWHKEVFTSDAINETIVKGFAAFNYRQLRETGQIWHSNAAISESQAVDNKIITRTYYAGFASGVSGILYLISQAQKVGVQTDHLQPGIQKVVDYLFPSFSVPTNQVPGLYFGAAGVAVGFNAAIHAGLIQRTEPNLNLIYECLKLPTTTLDLATGASGQGMAILHCAEFLSPKSTSQLLSHIFERLHDAQRPDGSWVTPTTARSQQTITGLAYGVSGVLSFLIEYNKYAKSNDAGEVIQKGLHWLHKNARKNKNTLQWNINSREKKVNHWLQEGNIGIILCFLKAYEALGGNSRREVAEMALQGYPQLISNGNLTQWNGLAGLGEIYLEAHRILQDVQWKERADWIAKSLLHLQKSTPDNGSIWHVDRLLPTADLMTGNGGVLHFLLRYRNMEELPFPLFPKL